MERLKNDDVQCEEIHREYLFRETIIEPTVVIAASTIFAFLCVRDTWRIREIYDRKIRIYPRERNFLLFNESSAFPSRSRRFPVGISIDENASSSARAMQNASRKIFTAIRSPRSRGDLGCLFVRFVTKKGSNEREIINRRSKNNVIFEICYSNSVRSPRGIRYDVCTKVELNLPRRLASRWQFFAARVTTVHKGIIHSCELCNEKKKKYYIARDGRCNEERHALTDDSSVFLLASVARKWRIVPTDEPRSGKYHWRHFA